MPLTVAWTEHEPLIAGLIRRFVERAGHQADLFATHAELLEADRRGHCEVVVLAGQDDLRADTVREAVLARAPRSAVALCSGCGCAGGLEGAHGVHAELYDRFWPKSFDVVEPLAWLAARDEPGPSAATSGTH